MKAFYIIWLIGVASLFFIKDVEIKTFATITLIVSFGVWFAIGLFVFFRKYDWHNSAISRLFRGEL